MNWAKIIIGDSRKMIEVKESSNNKRGPKYE